MKKNSQLLTTSLISIAAFAIVFAITLFVPSFKSWAPAIWAVFTIFTISYNFQGKPSTAKEDATPAITNAEEAIQNIEEKLHIIEGDVDNLLSAAEYLTDKNSKQNHNINTMAAMMDHRTIDISKRVSDLSDSQRSAVQTSEQIAQTIQELKPLIEKTRDDISNTVVNSRKDDWGTYLMLDTRLQKTNDLVQELLDIFAVTNKNGKHSAKKNGRNNASQDTSELTDADFKALQAASDTALLNETAESPTIQGVG